MGIRNGGLGLGLLLCLISNAGASIPVSIVGCTNSQIDGLQAQATAIESNLREINWGSIPISRFDFQWVNENFIVAENREPRFSPQNPVRSQQTYEQYHLATTRVMSAMQDFVSRGYDLYCLTSYNPSCARYPERLAFVRVGPGGNPRRVNLCDRFFGVDPTTQTKTLFHEISHLAADTDDFPPSGGWSLEKISRYPRDAYHVERFALGNIAYVLRSEVWFPLWKRKK